jgi:hypothetical protein
MTVKSVLHEIVSELNRPHLHAHIDETEEEYQARTAKVTDPRDAELASLRAAVSALENASANRVQPSVTDSEPVKEVEVSA